MCSSGRRRLDWLAYTSSMAGGFCPFAVANLLGSELASANAATPAPEVQLAQLLALVADPYAWLLLVRCRIVDNLVES